MWGYSSTVLLVVVVVGDVVVGGSSVVGDMSERCVDDVSGKRLQKDTDSSSAILLPLV